LAELVKGITFISPLFPWVEITLPIIINSSFNKITPLGIKKFN